MSSEPPVPSAPSADSKAPAEQSQTQANPPQFQVQASRQLPAWLAEHKVSLAFTTYKVGKIFMLGSNSESGRLSIFERTFARCMGLCISDEALYFSSLFQIWRMQNALQRGQLQDGYDRVYVPQVAYTTGDIDVHDMAVDAQGRLVFVSALFCCIATVSESHSFVPLWKPPFVSKIAAEDRCHMKGMAMRDGRPAFATAVSRSDVADGWRDRRHDGGVVLDIANNEIVCEGLSMPHSPRWYRGELWVLNSGHGQLGRVNLKSGQFEPFVFCPGYLRGLSFHGDYAVVGSSLPRHDQAFSGLALDGALAERDAEPRCGVQIIDLRTGDVVHWLRLQGVINELYDVAVLPGVIRPMAIGMVSDEIRRVISVGDAQDI